ncbi:unnamed protein product [Paramecium sonneborni]|uniref:RAP domain-containing protein n=1 Tax=Paramecium sonneborni TaxID=65129 RepID=A0A8S1PPK4_9CILI|nr:unnamed protein product [Paramecium sonneborni]
MIFNLYPEIIQQNYYNTKCPTDNPFHTYFHKLERNYRIARKIIDLKTGFQKADYFEYSNLNFLNIPLDFKDTKLTNLELSVSFGLESLKIKFEKQKRIIIYDVDFVLPNNVILNCNGPMHFITNLQQQIIGYSQNHQTTIRHLIQGQYQIIGIDFNDWNSQITLQCKQNYLKKLINLQ